MTNLAGAVFQVNPNPKVLLEDTNLSFKIVGVSEGDGARIVSYPKGWSRHHMVRDVTDLCAKISNQLLNKYNVKSFNFSKIPQSLNIGEEVEVGDIVYDT